MIIIKAYYHLIAILVKFIYSIIYFKKISIGQKTTWRSSFKLMIDKNGFLKIGEYCFFNNYCSINVNNRIEIGSNTIFGENVKIYDHNHRFNLKNKNISDQGFSNGTVKIGNNCWIGSNTTILKGSEIGDNVVIGAGMVIDSKIPSNTIVKRQSNYVINDIQYK